MAADHDRHFLFGLLALQVSLIDQAQLVAAFHAWTRDKARPLDDHLQALGHLNAEQRGLVWALAAQQLEKHGGDAEKSLAAVSVGASVRRSLADLGDPQINSTLVGLAFGPDVRESTASYSVGAPTSDGQRYRILRPHARGGLGAVFVALDEELHREVALKQILDDHADEPASRARFLLEAEITGGLEHPGIVPVYGLGTYADGRPFYAMRFIRGNSLKEAADRFHADEGLKRDPGRRSLELRKLLRRFTDVCNALDYAHSRGILHRDIKPGNIIVGKHGETLVVDWGLAKAVGRVEPGVDSGERMLVPSSSGGSAETLPGSAMGTPAYMSPEQAEGDLEHLGVKSDVYSLGATLYYLLTGRPPLAGDIGEVLQAAQRGEFIRPRRRDATIDPALEAVCLKAMAHRPEDRYASAKAMAEDVERWMADEPVSAWREPRARTLIRWLARHRSSVMAAGAAVLVALAGTGAGLAVQAQANAALTRTNIDLAIANAKATRANAGLQAANRRERQRFDLAMEAIGLFHGEVSQDLLLKEKQFEGLRSRLLKGAAEFYGKLERLLEGQSDPSSRAALGRAYFELGELTGAVGSGAEAVAVHRKGLAVRRELAGRPGADSEAGLDVVRSLHGLGAALHETGDWEEKSASYREAAELAEGLAASGRGSDEARLMLARSLRLNGSTGRLGGRRPEENLAMERRALAILSELAAKDPSAARYREELGECHEQIGLILATDMGRPAEALGAYEEAVAVYRVLVDARPEVYRLQNRLARLHNNISASLTRLGRREESIAARRRAVAIWRRAAEANPAVTELANNLGFGLNILAAHLTGIGRPAEALEALAEARPILRRLTEADFDSPAHPNNLATNYTFTGHALTWMGRWREAEAEYRAAVALYRKMVDVHPTINGIRTSLAWSHENLSQVLKETGRLTQAEDEYRAALEVQRKLADDYPRVPAFRDELASTRNRHGYLLKEMGRPDEAEAEYRAALAIRRELADREPAAPSRRDDVASAQTNLADLSRSLGRPAEARDDYDRAVALREQLVREAPKTVTYRSHLAYSLRRRGLARGELGDAAGAAADARRALGLYDGLESRSGEEWFETACCRAALAGAAGSGTSAGEGPAQADRAMALLRRAVAMGFLRLYAYRTEAALDPLRDRDDFRLLMMDLAMPAEPFAPAR